jgi:hypothetical protein
MFIGWSSTKIIYFFLIDNPPHREKKKRPKGAKKVVSINMDVDYILFVYFDDILLMNSLGKSLYGKNI